MNYLFYFIVFHVRYAGGIIRNVVKETSVLDV